MLEVEIDEDGGPALALAIEVLSVVDPPPALLIGLVVGLIPLSLFVGLVLPPSIGPITFLKVGCCPRVVVGGKGKVLLSEGLGLFGEVERLEARELGREEDARGRRGVVLGVEGRDWLIESA